MIWRDFQKRSLFSAIYHTGILCYEPDELSSETCAHMTIVKKLDQRQVSEEILECDNPQLHFSAFLCVRVFDQGQCQLLAKNSG